MTSWVDIIVLWSVHKSFGDGRETMEDEPRSRKLFMTITDKRNQHIQEACTFQSSIEVKIPCTYCRYIKRINTDKFN